MCGRYTRLYTWPELVRLMRLTTEPTGELLPSYNVAPTQEAPVVRQNRDGERTAAMLKWGLVPHWAEENAHGHINSRSETADTTAAFRDAFARRRCLVPASGFFEWKKLDDGSKQPYYVRLNDGPPFAFAGLWERREDTRTFAILTTDANDLLAPIHDRMPVILDPDDYDLWLDHDAEADALKELLHPYDPTALELFPVSPRVNTPKNDDPSLLNPVEEQRGLF